MEVHTCRMCKENYHEHRGDRASDLDEKYIRHLGFCEMNCFNKLTDKGKDYYIAYAYLYGDDLKRNNIKIKNKYLK